MVKWIKIMVKMLIYVCMEMRISGEKYDDRKNLAS